VKIWVLFEAPFIRIGEQFIYIYSEDLEGYFFFAIAERQTTKPRGFAWFVIMFILQHTKFCKNSLNFFGGVRTSLSQHNLNSGSLPKSVGYACHPYEIPAHWQLLVTGAKKSYKGQKC
jgi:hypothetical protein